MWNVFKKVLKRKPRAVFLTARVFTPVDHPLRATLDQRYLDMRAAMASGSAEKIAAILAPDFVSFDINGKPSDADAMIASVINLDVDRSKRHPTTTVFAIDQHAEAATVGQHYAMWTDADAPASMSEYLQTRSVDVWRLIENVWLLGSNATQELEVMYRDGRFKHVRCLQPGVWTELSSKDMVK